MKIGHLLQVHGTLKIANAYSAPFHAFCPQCNYKFHNYGALEDQTAHCFKCDEDVTYIYSLYLKTTVTTENNQTVQCFCDNSIIQLLLPALSNLTYDKYIADKTTIVFILRDFSKRGNFTLNRYNLIINATSLQE